MCIYIYISYVYACILLHIVIKRNKVSAYGEGNTVDYFEGETFIMVTCYWLHLPLPSQMSSST